MSRDQQEWDVGFQLVERKFSDFCVSCSSVTEYRQALYMPSGLHVTMRSNVDAPPYGDSWVLTRMVSRSVTDYFYRYVPPIGNDAEECFRKFDAVRS